MDTLAVIQIAVHIGLVALALATSVVSPRAQSVGDVAADVRAYPYPFSHVFTAVSDADYQLDWFGLAWRKEVSERLGLHFGDSLFAYSPGHNERTPSLFVGRDGWNRYRIAADGHTDSIHLFREWHRHNIDHFHSWSSDTTPTLRLQLETPARIVDGAIVEIASRSLQSPEMEASRHLLRLEFDRLPPPDLALNLEFDDGTSASFDAASVARGANVQVSPVSGRAIIEIALQKGGVPPETVADATLARSQVKRLEFRAPSCSPGCGTHLVALELGAFSRLLVQRQLDLLKHHRVFPALITSHGGFTNESNYFGTSAQITNGCAGKGLWIACGTRAAANDPSSHAYLTDLLPDLGTVAVWPLDWQGGPPFTNHVWTEPVPPLTADVSRLYTFQETIGPNHEGTENIPENIMDISVADRLHYDISVDELFCQTNNVYCNSSGQGGQIGGLALLTLNETQRRSGVEHAWHTHMGTALHDPRVFPTSAAPLSDANVESLRLLADRQYNFSAEVGEKDRIWVIPPSRLVLYRLVSHLLAGRVAIEAGSLIRISPVIDPVTKRRIPDPIRPARDLHGFTIYVRGAEQSRVFVGDTEIHSIVRNPPDASGRESVTIVDSSSARIVLDEISPEKAGSIDITSASMEHRVRADAAAGDAYLRLVAQGRNPRLVLTLEDLTLYNVSHLRAALRMSRLDGSMPIGRPFIQFIRSDGRVIGVLSDEMSATKRSESSWWRLPGATSEAWQHHLLPTSALVWSRGEQSARYPALPLGRIERVIIGLDGASPGDVLDLDDLAFLRPNANGLPAENAYLVAGRVTNRPSVGAGGVVVTLQNEREGTELQTVTDAQGYFLFNEIAPRSLISLFVKLGDRPCYSPRGKSIDIADNEAELDIALFACHP